MQIHEITRNKARLNEAPEYTTPGGIVVPGGAKTAATPAAAPAAAATPAAAPAAAATPAAAAAAPQQGGYFSRTNLSDIVGNLQQKLQTRKVQQNTAMASKVALQQWNNKVIQLTQAAGGQPVDPTEYENQLADFVERVMLRSYKIGDMDPQSQQRIEQAIGDVVQNRNDRNALSSAFEKLAQQTVVARLDSTKTAYQSPAAQKTLGPGAKQAPGQPAAPMNAQQATNAVGLALRNANVNVSQLAKQLQAQTGPVSVNKTNNPVVDALLRTAGIQVT